MLAMAPNLTEVRWNYPAPYRAIDVIRTSLSDGMPRGLEAEAQAFGELAMTEVSRRLVEVFYATTALKKDDGTLETAAISVGRDGVNPPM